MYIYSAIQNKFSPSVADLTSALRSADDDNITSIDTRPLMSILMRFKTIDPRLRGHILTRETAVSSFEWTLTPRSQNPSPSETEAAERARLRCEPLIREITRARLQATLFDAMVVETSITRDTPLGAVQTPRRRYRPVEIEKTSDYEVGLYATDAQKNVTLRLPVQMGLPNDVRANYIIAVGDDDVRGGLLRSIAHHEILLWDAKIEYANFLTLLQGIIQGIIDEGASEEEKIASVETLKTAKKHKWIITSKAIEFKLNQMADAGAGDTFKTLMEMLRADIAITLLGQANTSELPANGGSRAGLQILNLIRSDIMFDDMIRTEQCINSQVLLNDARLNLDPNLAEAPYKFAFSMPDGLDPETRARIITDAYTAGIPILRSEAYRELGLTPPPENADILQHTSAMP